MPKLILNCSFSQEKKYKEWFKDLVASKFEQEAIEDSHRYSLPVFRCKDMLRVANTRDLQEVLSYSDKCYSPSTHIRVGTIYGDNFEELVSTIASLKDMEENNK